MTDSVQALSPRARLVVALVLVAAGVLPLLAAFDVGPLRRADINGPPWLAAVAGGVFIIAGAAIVADRAGREHPLAGLLFASIVAGFAAIANWIAFGAGPRECTRTITTFFGGGSGPAGDVECRIAFGVGALMLNGMLVFLLVRGVARLIGPGVWSTRIAAAGKAVLLLSLAPILVPVILLLLVTSAGSAVVTYVKTGQWPRNEAFIARMRRRHSGS